MKNKTKLNKGFRALALPVVVLSLSIQAQELEEVVVSGSFIPDEKRDTAEINVVLDSSDIERTGDDNIAVALTRLTGLSLVRGKYVYVRGLGERYSSATLNGSSLPSPEPLKRVVPLDIFPTAAIQSALVQKTYSAEMAGEFGGGMIAIKTKAVPFERVLSLSFSSGFNDATSLSDGLLYDGGGDDDFGYDDGTRNYPALLGQSIASGTKVDRSNYATYELANFGRQFENSKLWVIQEGDVPVNNSFNFTYGSELDWDLNSALGLDSASAGVFFTLGMKSDWQTQEGLRQTGDLQAQAGGRAEVILAENKQTKSTSNDVSTYAMGVFGLETDLTELKYTSLYIHKGTKKARIIYGFDPSDAQDIREDYLAFFERSLFNHQLNYSQLFNNGSSLDVRLTNGKATRDAPYEREIFYQDSSGVVGTSTPDSWLYDVNTGKNQTQFSSVDDNDFNFGLDVSIPLELETMDIELKAGIDYRDNNRDAEVRSFRFSPAGGPLPAEALSQRVDYIFADQNFDPNRLLVIENTASSSPAGYEGVLETSAAYVSMDALISNQFRLSTGIRQENGKQEINTYDLFIGKDNIVEKTIDEDYALPAITLTYFPERYENLQIRLGLSQTIARPTFRELSPTLFIDPDTDRVVAGSLFLENTELNNIDLRAEYYFDLNQFMTFGVFFKDINKPIEETVNEIGDLIVTTYQNVPKAELSGFEFEYERIFDDFRSTWASSKEFMLKVNYTFTDSEIIIGSGDTYINSGGVITSAASLLANGRDPRLQGQAENIFNLQFGYDDYSVNSQATFILNYVDDRVRARGLDVLPDVIEQIPMTINFVYSREFELDTSMLKVSLEIRNLLNEEYEATMANSNIFYDQYELGSSISLGFKLNF